MVFFNCDACGESLKKNQVEKHYMTKCRSCNVLSCVDCGKEFVGDAFKEHIKCITEEEKYSGKNYKPKANANKGERKQELWTEQVQQAIGKAPANNPKLKALLNQVIEFPNIPRKKAKFENFVKNSMRVREPYLITQAWDALSAGMTNQNPPPPAADSKTSAEPSTSSQPKEVVTKTDTNGTTEGSTEEPKKLSKREKKEERRKQTNKTEKKDKGKESRDDEKSEKKRKRKHEEMEESEETIDEEPEDEEPEDESKKQKSKKKKRKQEVEVKEIAEEEVQVKKKAKKAKGENGFEVCRLNKTLESDEEDAVPKKFKLDTVIFEILNKSSDKEMVIKKLIKKVQAAFLASGGGGKGNTEEKMLGKLQKRLGKSPKYTVHKNRVKLVIDTTSDD